LGWRGRLVAPVDGPEEMALLFVLERSSASAQCRISPVPYACLAAVVRPVRRSPEQFMQTDIYHNGTIHLMAGSEDPGALSMRGRI